MTMVDIHGQGPYQVPHRKPVAGPINPNRSNDLRPLSKIVPDIDMTTYTQQQQEQRRRQQHLQYPLSSAPIPTSAFSTYPARTSSHGKLPTNSPISSSTITTTTTLTNHYQNPTFTSRRTPSQSTASTTGGPSRHPSTTSSNLSRTASSRSGASTTPGSYVALMRKQKATVWCDRSQHEDPRLLAQQKAARMRAVREITATAGGEGRSSMSGSVGGGSLGVRSKIRHHGLPKASGYSSANIVGGGVPTRLSANEVGDEGTWNGSPRGGSHQRSGSGTSARSEGVGNRWLTVEQKQDHRLSQSGTAISITPPASGPNNNDHPLSSEFEETPVPTSHQPDYFSQPSSSSSAINGGNGSNSSGSEHERGFGNVGQIKAPSVQAKKERMEDELRRRGSVDERANTMGYMGGGAKLFVANPDLSD